MVGSMADSAMAEGEPVLRRTKRACGYREDWPHVELSIGCECRTCRSRLRLDSALFRSAFFYNTRSLI